MAAVRFTRTELEQYNHKNKLVIIIDNLVYNITNFFNDHPGGVEVLLNNGGKDASKCFHDVGHSEIALEWRQKFLIGQVVDEDKWEIYQRDTAPPARDETFSLRALYNVWGPPILLALVAAVLYIYLF